MDISQESDPKSQDHMPVSFILREKPRIGLECHVRERYLKKISVVGHSHSRFFLDTVQGDQHEPETRTLFAKGVWVLQRPLL